ncbi:MAG TPA: hypothetical protein VHB74_13370 [Devosia sp.]|nr:hypothetical protein [Devosia sp.]
MTAKLDKRDDDLFLRRRRQRSLALGLVLLAFVVIVYILTFVKMGTYHTL